MGTAVALLTRDLRVHDNPVLVAACEADAVVPLFVVDPGVREVGDVGPSRAAVLVEALADLHAALVERGGGLLVRHGRPESVLADVLDRTGADEVHVLDDVSRFAARRLERLRAVAGERGARVHAWPGVTVVAPGELRPSGGRGAFQVFTPYWRRWVDVPLDEPVPPPRRVRLDDAVVGDAGLGALPRVADLAGPGAEAPQRLRGGEQAARRRLDDWLAPTPADADAALAQPTLLDPAPPGTASSATAGDRPTPAAACWHVDRYAVAGTAAAGGVAGHDNVAVDATSGLSADLHLGALSVREVVARLDRSRPGHEAFLRQLCWRDFHHQLAAAHGDVRGTPVRPRGDAWRPPDGGAARAWRAWTEGRTGYPLVDAGMRQLAATGWMHNRARMVVASFLTKHLRIDWRAGERFFMRSLVDGDVANNALNWQWVAGVGVDSRPNRILSPVRQAERFDPTGAYVRRWVPELVGLPDALVLRPWEAATPTAGYAAPLVDHAEARAAFLAEREAATPPRVR